MNTQEEPPDREDKTRAEYACMLFKILYPADGKIIDSLNLEGKNGHSLTSRVSRYHLKDRRMFDSFYVALLTEAERKTHKCDQNLLSLVLGESPPDFLSGRFFLEASVLFYAEKYPDKIERN